MFHHIRAAMRADELDDPLITRLMTSGSFKDGISNAAETTLGYRRSSSRCAMAHFPRTIMPSCMASRRASAALPLAVNRLVDTADVRKMMSI